MAKNGRPPKFNTPKELKEKIEEYFGNCDENREMPTKAGLALHLDTTRETLGDYEDGSRDNEETKEDGLLFSDTIKRAYLIIENAWTQKLSGNNATGPIFYLKAAFKYRDRVDVTSDDKELPQPIMNVLPNIGNEENSESQEEN